MFLDLKIQIPDIYLLEPIEHSTFDLCLKDKSNLSVVKTLFKIKNEVKESYYFMEINQDTGYYIEAKIIPQYAFAGKAKQQIKKNIYFKDLLTQNPYYKIKLDLFLEKNYKKIWSFNESVSNKKHIYNIIEDLKHYLKNKIQSNLQNV